MHFPLASRPLKFLFSRLEEARDTYKKVIEIDPRNVPAMTLLGSVYQLMDDPDSAIVKYHEVCLLAFIPGVGLNSAGRR